MFTHRNRDSSKLDFPALDVAEELLRLGWEIGAVGETDSGGLLRIGHMGETTEEQLGEMLTALGQVLAP